MKTRNLLRLVLVVSGSALLGAGCDVHTDVHNGGPSGQAAVAAPGEVYVDSAPPALLVETQPPMPGDGYIWIGGNWFWEGSRWNWHPGRWDRPPHPGARFVANHYENRGGRHVYVAGGWR